MNDTAQSERQQLPQIDPESETFLDDIAQMFCDSGGLGIGELLGIDKEQQEQLYAFASMLYESGQFEQACDVFAYLCRVQPTEGRFVKALGMARQMAKQFEAALDAYSLAVLHDVEDAEISIHAAECLLHLGEIGRARAAVKGAELQVLARPVSEELQRKMQTLKDALVSYDAADSKQNPDNGAIQGATQGGGV